LESLSSARRNSRNRLGCGHEQQPKVEKQVSHLIGGYELSVLNIAEAAIYNGQCLSDHVSRKRLGHGATLPRSMRCRASAAEFTGRSHAWHDGDSAR
jgi:hypothetical protein